MILFKEEQPGMFDLLIDGRAVEVDVAPIDFSAAIRRSRVDTSREKIFVEDITGYRERLSR